MNEWMNEQRMKVYATFVHIQAKLDQEDLLRMGRWITWHCHPHTKFEIRSKGKHAIFTLNLYTSGRGIFKFVFWNLPIRDGDKSASSCVTGLPALTSNVTPQDNVWQRHRRSPYYVWFGLSLIAHIIGIIIYYDFTQKADLFVMDKMISGRTRRPA